VENRVKTPSYQYGLLIVIDVLLTGAVLAGGSKKIHEVFNLHEAVMNSSQSILESQKIVQSTPPVPATTGGGS
jgi:hypothetical protein